MSKNDCDKPSPEQRDDSIRLKNVRLQNSYYPDKPTNEVTESSSADGQTSPKSKTSDTASLGD